MPSPRPRKGSLATQRHLPVAGVDSAPACIYIRVSTEEQQLSIDSQRKTLLAFATQHDITVDSVFIDHGVSACKHAFQSRPEARRMLRHMRRHGLSTVLILRIDRAFRSVSDCYTTLPDLQRQGIFFRFIDPDIDFTTPIGKAQLSLMAAFAEFEADLRSQRQCAGFDELRQRRVIRNNNPPYGWDAVPDPSISTRSGRPSFRLVPNPAEQAILREIVQTHDSGRGASLSAIAADLNQRGIRTKKAGQTRKWRGRTTTIKGRWTHMTVRSVIEHADLATPEELTNTTTTPQHQ